MAFFSHPFLKSEELNNLDNGQNPNLLYYYFPRSLHNSSSTHVTRISPELSQDNKFPLNQATHTELNWLLFLCSRNPKDSESKTLVKQKPEENKIYISNRATSTTALWSRDCFDLYINHRVSADVGIISVLAVCGGTPPFMILLQVQIGSDGS